MKEVGREESQQINDNNISKPSTHLNFLRIDLC